MLSLTINKTRALVRFLIQMSSLFVKRSLEREENECPPRLYCKNRLTKIFTHSRGFSFLTFLCALASGSGGSRGYIYSERSPCAPPSLFYTRALSLSLISPSLSYLSLSLLSLPLSYLSLPLYISPFTFLSLFSLSFSLAYLMDVFVLVCLKSDLMKITGFLNIKTT